ncbi:hypothetical protein IMG5_072120 [Ichthyophthirius multifiliis]|uniref:Transmembrane protein n=1 Tax=Ichthyophthirius multifiliis TaxID=5932 RepID=G0QPX2_ICHMU|nr:hypothetical protein IMG5_072120 [Ichthyophthirius multifiliis]EGR32734.1 hypothetical protein IMG5_072120 [Ichthyophthirius multifiliis]|eukprot:XP_004036720.1 hypothetical protein IMG5_072120 [Ichthyophthirius multifiliis]
MQTPQKHLHGPHTNKILLFQEEKIKIKLENFGIFKLISQLKVYIQVVRYVICIILKILMKLLLLMGFKLMKFHNGMLINIRKLLLCMDILKGYYIWQCLQIKKILLQDRQKTLRFCKVIIYIYIKYNYLQIFPSLPKIDINNQQIKLNPFYESLRQKINVFFIQNNKYFIYNK